MMHGAFLSAADLTVETPSGRVLVQDLQMRIEADRVAIVGRNGVGKSMLMEVLAGYAAPARGRVQCRGSRVLVRQRLDAAASSSGAQSAGETRKRLLNEARSEQGDFLLL